MKIKHIIENDSGNERYYGHTFLAKVLGRKDLNEEHVDRFVAFLNREKMPPPFKRGLTLREMLDEVIEDRYFEGDKLSQEEGNRGKERVVGK